MEVMEPTNLRHGLADKDKPMVSVGETNSQLAARLFQLKGNKNSALSSDCMTIMGMSDAS